MNFKKLFQFFRWFDDSLGLFLQGFIPYKTNFLGIQFMIESHILERTKMRYNYFTQYAPAQAILSHVTYSELQLEDPFKQELNFDIAGGTPGLGEGVYETPKY
jgi:hypothetical protein